jgi:hypothetical protein
LVRAVHDGSRVERHVHRRPDGLVVLCVRAWCAPGWRKATTRRALIAVPFAAVAASATFGRPRLAIVLGMVAAIALAVRVTMALGARIDRDAVAPPRTTRRSRTG